MDQLIQQTKLSNEEIFTVLNQFITEVIGEENLHKSVNNALKAFLSGSVVPSEEDHE